MHPNNRHRQGYDLAALASAVPELADYLIDKPNGEQTVDFAKPEAVRWLNTALLRHDYGIQGFQLPAHSLCPPVPSRADYLLHLNDFLGQPSRATLLDIGTGASGIYPLLGVSLFNWQWVASDISRRSLNQVKRTLSANPKHAGAIRLRQQPKANKFLQTVIRPGEQFTASVCNPPFFKSSAQAQAANERKTRNLATQSGLNFGGAEHELWCEGGEIAFIIGMIDESWQYRQQVGWFTSLVSREKSLGPIIRRLTKHRLAYHVVAMDAGQKRSRFIAWQWPAATKKSAS